LPEDSLGLSCEEDSDCPGDTYCVEEVCVVPLNRGLIFEPRNGGREVALMIVLLPNSLFGDHEGRIQWVQAPRADDPEGVCRLGCKPVYRDWSRDSDVIYVTDALITPQSFYAVVAATPSSVSSVLTLRTVSRRGDVAGPSDGIQYGPPDGEVNQDDIFGLYARYRNDPGAPSIAQCDLWPERPDHMVDFADITFVLDTLWGEPYPFAMPAACDDR
jgi:hypothetical protein